MDYGVKWVRLFLAILLILAVVALVSTYWHTFPVENYFVGAHLDSYNSKVSDGDACLTVTTEYYQVDDVDVDVLIWVNEKLIDTFKIYIPGNETVNYCIDNSHLLAGKNFVEIGVYGKRVWFEVEKVESLEEYVSEINLLGVEKKNDYKAELNFIVKNFLGKEEKAKIFVNDEKVLEAFYLDGNHTEIVPIVSGSNKIRIEFGGNTKETNIQNDTLPVSNIIFGLIIISFSIFISMTFVFSNKTLGESVLYSIMFFIIQTMLVFFVLNYVGILSNLTFIGFFILVTILVAAIFRNEFSVPKLSLPKMDHFVILFAIFLLVILFFNFTTPTNVSFWTSFYERQSRSVFENNGTPMFDEFTHFGEKEFGYLSGYFFVNAGVSYFTGQFGETNFALMMLLADGAFIIAGILFFKKIGLDDSQAKLATLLMLFGGFILGDIFFNIRHVMSLSLALISLILYKEDRKVLAGIIAGLAVFIQTPILLFIAILALTFNKFEKTELLKYFVSAIITAGALLIPSIIIHGIPFQAQSTVWGYLFGMPFYGVLVDLFAQLLFAFLIMLPLVGFKPKFDGLAKKVAVILILLIIVQLFVSYRVNIATIVIFTFLGVYLFPRKLLGKFEVRHLLFIIFFFSFVFSAIFMLNYVVPDYALEPALFVKENVSSESRILAEPALGHYLIYFAEKQVLADLAVEYAFDEYINDSFNFLLEKDESILKKYNIEYVYSRPYIIERQPVGSPVLDEALEFEFMNRIYDNGHFHLYRTRSS